MKLMKHKGKTTDMTGCQFHYTCYKSKDIFGNVIECVYVCTEFKHVESRTLKGLKELMSNV